MTSCHHARSLSVRREPESVSGGLLELSGGADGGDRSGVGVAAVGERDERAWLVTASSEVLDDALATQLGGVRGVAVCRGPRPGA